MRFVFLHLFATNIVGFLEAFLENNETELCIVMEYCGCGDLAQKVERYKRQAIYRRGRDLEIYDPVCQGLENLHGKEFAIETSRSRTLSLRKMAVSKLGI